MVSGTVGLEEITEMFAFTSGWPSKLSQKVCKRDIDVLVPRSPEGFKQQIHAQIQNAFNIEPMHGVMLIHFTRVKNIIQLPIQQYAMVVMRQA